MKNSLKVIASTVLLSFVLIPNVQADNLPRDATVVQQENKREIPEDQLPQKVQDAIAEGDYKDWKIDKVFLISKPAGITYEVQYLNANDESENEKYDAEGNLLDD